MSPASLDHAHCYAAIQAHDARFDGLFFVAVRSTRVYCRPVCRVRLPRAENCTFYPSAATAEQAGYRPCRRCRPELAPGRASVDAVRRVAHQAAEQIRAGALTERSLEALAADFALSSRQLRRVVEAEYGVGPLALAMTHRLHLGKQLLTDTQLKIIDVAYASGFSSLRRFNDAFRRHYRLKPSDLRRGTPGQPPDTFTLRLGYRPPLAWQALGSFLASRGDARVEQWCAGHYRRVVRIGALQGWIDAHHDPAARQVVVEVSCALLAALPRLQVRLRTLFDLDASPALIDSHLGTDPLLAPLLEATPGLRVPGSLDPFELCLRAILGQQITVKAATTLFGRFVERFGDAVETPWPNLDRAAPRAETIAATPLQTLIDVGLTSRRAATIQAVARGVAGGDLDWQRGDRQQTIARFLTYPGIGPWTAHYVAMRALGDPNALPAADLGLMRALDVDTASAVARRTEGWQPWRAYGALHLWSASTRTSPIPQPTTAPSN